MADVQNLLRQAFQLHQTGQLREAINLYVMVLPQQKNNAQLHYLLGTANLQIGQHKQAIEHLHQSLAIDPKNFSAHYNLGIALQDVKRLDEALASYDCVLALKPNYAEAFNNRGSALKDLKRLEDALASYDQAIALKPDYAEAHNNRGLALQDLKRLDGAVASYDQAIALRPDYAGAHYNRGFALKDLKRLDDALTSYDEAIALKPDYAEAHNNRGLALHDLKRMDDALTSYDQAIALKPDYADAYYNRGITLIGLKRLDDALASYDQAIALKFDYAEAYNNRGFALHDLKRLDDALASYDQAIAFKPDYADAYYNRGFALQDIKRLDEALASYDQAIALKPDYAAAYYNRGIVLQDLKRLDEALASYDQAIVLIPEHADAHNNRGIALQDLKRVDDALASYEKALNLKPEYEFLRGTIIHTNMMLCDWTDLTEHLIQLEIDIAQDMKVSTPFPLLGMTDKPELHLLASKSYINAKHPLNLFPRDFGQPKSNNKIRIGYYSADFHNHATAYLMAELFEAHDQSGFEVYGLSFGPNYNDGMRQRISAGFESFHDVFSKSDTEVAQISRNIGIDIAVDLKGFTKDSRTAIFAEGCAPIQVSYLGYPGSMGAPYIDYIIADQTVIPQSNQIYHSEKIVYLPNCYQVNDSQRKISVRVFTRQELGLPESGFVYCCFNNNYKILPATFDGWMRILKAIDGSVLWLFEDNPTAAKNLRKEAEARGVDSNRLVFAKMMMLDEHLARHRLADLFLDTLPYNAHTTASDALWAGLPVLTCAGKSFAARVAASLLNTMHLPELIAQSQQEYEAKAIELANNPAMLADIKTRLEQNRATSPLFDGRLFAKHIEIAYTAMYERYCAGLEPTHIFIEADGVPRYAEPWETGWSPDDQPALPL
jgi:predicted O-linked N-acetylglucosamine transferase (SPINDLY family)